MTENMRQNQYEDDDESQNLFKVNDDRGSNQKAQY